MGCCWALRAEACAKSKPITDKGLSFHLVWTQTFHFILPRHRGLDVYSWREKKKVDACQVEAHVTIGPALLHLWYDHHTEAVNVT